MFQECFKGVSRVFQGCFKGVSRQVNKRFLRYKGFPLAAIVGSISKQKVSEYGDISRKGFGGRNAAIDIDLVATVVQTANRVMRNRHPKTITTIPCMNSLYLWANRVSGHIVHFFNSLGDCYRFVNIQIQSRWSFRP